MRRRILVFKNGYRSIALGELSISPSVDLPIDEIDITDSSSEELNKISDNLYDDVYIKKVLDRIDNKNKNK